jgi:hypothetical protein
MEFKAAVRMKDGTKEVFIVSDEPDHESARLAVLREIPDAAVILVAVK